MMPSHSAVLGLGEEPFRYEFGGRIDTILGIVVLAGTVVQL
jgi:hypothetical protein